MQDRNKVMSFSVLFCVADNEEIHKRVGPRRFFRNRAEFVRCAIRYALANEETVTAWEKSEPNMPWLKKEV